MVRRLGAEAHQNKHGLTEHGTERKLGENALLVAKSVILDIQALSSNQLPASGRNVGEQWEQRFRELPCISGIPVHPVGLKDAIEDFVVNALLSTHHSVEGSRSELLNRESLNNTLEPETDSRASEQ
jgi:hypothetical protein